MKQMMGDWNEDNDQFFDMREEITSVYDSSSIAGDTESTVGGELISRFGYEFWIKSPGTILERRQRLMSLMGLCAAQNNIEDPASDLEGPEVEIDRSRITEDSGAALRSDFGGWRCSTDSSEVFGQALDENLDNRIRNLDNGTEFIVDELGQDGFLSRLREIGSNRLVTGEEFERFLGWSPLVQKAMKKDAAQENSRSVVKRRAKKGWLKRLGTLACIPNVEVGLRNADDDGCSSNCVRVRTFRKRTKELSALYVGQDLVAHSGAISAMKFSPDGQLLASAGEDGVVRIWQVIQTQRSPSFHIVDAKPSSGYFIINDLSELVPLDVDKEKRSKLEGLGKSSESICVVFPERIFHIAEKPLHEFHGHHGEVLDLSWSKDKCVLSSSVDKTVCLWRVGFDQCQRVFSHNDYVTCVQFNPADENYFISGSIDGKVRIWDVSGGAVVDWIDMKEIVTALSYQPDGKGAVVGSIAGDCIFFGTSDNRLQLVNQMCLQGKKKSSYRRITGLQFSPVDAGKLMITSADSHVRILQGSNMICKYRGFRNSGSRISASFTPDGTHIVSASEDSNVYMWDYVAPDRPVSSRVKSTSSCERFFSNNASIAVPWNGTLSGSPIFSCPTTPSGIVVKYMAECGTQQPLSGETPYNRFALFSSATWPEEKLARSAPLSVSASANKSEYKFVKAACQNMAGSHHSWGSVFVTAGLDGRIRVFENFGLPVQL